MAELPVDCWIGSRFCGKCCVKAIVPLTPEDLERLSREGFALEEVVERRFGVPVLKLVEGRCFFLDPATGACRIYRARPEACRLYPLIHDGLWVRVDPACPKAFEVSRDSADRLAARVLEFYERVKRAWASGDKLQEI
ncbi:MAG: YkgJ family cysteine cluster protein [Thermofilum sp.]